MVEQLAVFGIDVQDAGEEKDLGGVAARGTEAWYDGTGGAIVGSDQDDSALLARSAVGHGAASGDAGGQVEGKQGLADAWIAFQEGEGSQRDAVLPEPVDGSRGEVVEEVAPGDGGVFGAGTGGLRVGSCGLHVFEQAGEGDTDGTLAGAFFFHFGAGGGEEFSLLLALLLSTEKFFNCFGVHG